MYKIYIIVLLFDATGDCIEAIPHIIIIIIVRDDRRRQDEINIAVVGIVMWRTYKT